MTLHNKWTGAAHLEEIASAMTEINTKPDEGRFLGIEAIAEEAIEQIKEKKYTDFLKKINYKGEVAISQRNA